MYMVKWRYDCNIKIMSICEIVCIHFISEGSNR
jgi:hypothetical protein